MSDLPHLSIGFVTYRRTSEALTTIRTTSENLKYPKELRSWYVADDGSPGKHFDVIMNELRDRGETVLGSHHERLRNDGEKDTYNSGKGWNKALGICHQRSDFVLWLEDDWELAAPLDIERYIHLLEQKEDIGLVSFRILSTGADVHTTGWDGEIFLRYDRTTQYAYSGNPLLRHARYTKHYGWFAEDRSPGLMELHQDDMYRFRDAGEGKFIPREKDDGPQIWRPAMLDHWGAWHHIGSDKTWS